VEGNGRKRRIGEGGVPQHGWINPPMVIHFYSNLLLTLVTYIIIPFFFMYSFGFTIAYLAARRLHSGVFTARRNARIASAVLAIAIPSVCPSVCLSHAGIVSKRLNVG